MGVDYGFFIREQAIKNLLSAQRKMAAKGNAKGLIAVTKFILRGYEMYYVDELGNIGITYLSPMDAFMIYDDSVLQRERFFVRLYIDSDQVLHGSVSDETEVRWFVMKGKLIWEEESKIHGFDGVPATEYSENKERIGIFEPVLTMIDAYNKAISEKANDVEADR